jgi:hypothetical protein
MKKLVYVPYNFVKIHFLASIEKNLENLKRVLRPLWLLFTKIPTYPLDNVDKNLLCFKFIFLSEVGKILLEGKQHWDGLVCAKKQGEGLPTSVTDVLACIEATLVHVENNSTVKMSGFPIKKIAPWTLLHETVVQLFCPLPPPFFWKDSSFIYYSLTTC